MNIRSSRSFIHSHWKSSKQVIESSRESLEMRCSFGTGLNLQSEIDYHWRLIRVFQLSWAKAWSIKWFTISVACRRKCSWFWYQTRDQNSLTLFCDERGILTKQILAIHLKKQKVTRCLCRLIVVSCLRASADHEARHKCVQQNFLDQI